MTSLCLYCIFAQESFAAYCISLWEIQMCFLAASECLQLCMTLLLASLHRVQTEKRRLRAKLFAASISLYTISSFNRAHSPLSLFFYSLPLTHTFVPTCLHLSFLSARLATLITLMLVWPVAGSQRACSSRLQKVCPYTFFEAGSSFLSHTSVILQPAWSTSQMSAYKLLKDASKKVKCC